MSYGCGWSGPTEPTDCDGVFKGIGALPAWYAGASVVLTCNVEDISVGCYKVLSSGDTPVSTPNSLPDFSANPITSSGSTGDWCSLETERGIWGTGGNYADWSARVYFKAIQCDAAGSGTDKNTIVAIAQILLDGDLVWARSFYSVSDSASATTCKCTPASFGSAGSSWTMQCSGDACGIALSGVEDYHGGIKWPVYGGQIASSAFSWSSSRGDACCEDLGSTYNYYGCNDSSTPTVDCPDCDSPGPCGTFDPNHLAALGIQDPPDESPVAGSNSYHLGIDYKDTSCIGDWCMMQNLGFTTSGIPGFTDVLLASISI